MAKMKLNVRIDYADMGERVRTLRRQRRVTQEELAQQIGISASFMGHIERGTRVASLETLVSICNVLQAAPEYFLGNSLHHLDNRMPTGITAQERARLTEFLRLAQQTLHRWEDEDENDAGFTDIPEDGNRPMD